MILGWTSLACWDCHSAARPTACEMGQAITLEQAFESNIDAVGQARSTVDQDSVKLYQCGASTDFFIRILCRKDAADADDRDVSLCTPIHMPNDFRRPLA